MNPFNQAWVILKESNVYDSDLNLSSAYTSRMYTECEECGWLHNNPICDYCEAVHNEYNPNPQYEKTRLGNKEFANEKELLEYLEANPPQKGTHKPHTQLKLTNFGDIDYELGPALVNTNTLSEYLGEEPVMYAHMAGKRDIPSIMARGLDPEFANTRSQGVWEAEQAKLHTPESQPIYVDSNNNPLPTNRKHDYHEYSGLLPAIHDMMPEEVRELYDSPTNLTPEEQREAIINAMKPAVFLTQPDKTALTVMGNLMHRDEPRMVGVRGMLPPNKLGERNIDETHDMGLPEKTSLEKIPPERLVFYNQDLKPIIGYGATPEHHGLNLAEDSPVMNTISDYQNLYQQGVVPQPGYFPTQEHYDRYQANRQ